MLQDNGSMLQGKHLRRRDEKLQMATEASHSKQLEQQAKQDELDRQTRQLEQQQASGKEV